MEYMQRMFISNGLIRAEDISSGYNVLNPNYLKRCIDKSLSNMHLTTLDLVYIHNAFESWFEDISREEFLQRLSKVFEVYEEYRAGGKIRYYGMATWTCFRVTPDNREYLSLEDVTKIAEKVGGSQRHGFRFIQLPYNLAYSEALLLRNQSVGSEKNLTVLEAAQKLGIGVFTSIPLFQGRLLRAQVPDYGGMTDQVSKLLQVVRSSPSVIAPLIGQKNSSHVKHNLMLSIIYDRMQNSERYKQERYSKIMGKGKDKDYSYYYIYGKKTTHSLRYTDKEGYDFLRAVEPSEQPRECKHGGHYAKLSDMINKTHKLSKYYYW